MEHIGAGEEKEDGGGGMKQETQFVYRVKLPSDDPEVLKLFGLVVQSSGPRGVVWEVALSNGARIKSENWKKDYELTFALDHELGETELGVLRWLERPSITVDMFVKVAERVSVLDEKVRKLWQGHEGAG